MRAGQLTDVIKILRYENIESEYGGEKRELKLFYTTRANPIYGSGSRVVLNTEMAYPENWTFEVRKYVPVIAEDVIEWKGNRYYINSIQPDRKRQNLYISTTLLNE